MRKYLLFSIALGVTIPGYSFAKKSSLSNNSDALIKAYFHLKSIQNSISGLVSDNSGPISGVTVRVVETGVSVSTDTNGKYSINAAIGNTLRFTSIGYDPVDVKVVNVVTNVQLKVIDNSLDEVVVTALGIERNKKNLTYSVQTVTGDDLRASNQGNILNGLQGKIAGAQISSSGGSPGLPTEIILRGSSSLTGDNQPLMIVDGIRVNNSSSNGTVNRIADINPEDIEDISILKGAAAAALYGIDAASGAIVITTKKGKAGVMQIGGSYKAFVETMGRLPSQQTIYTTGTGGTYDESSGSSWGRKFRYDETIYNNVQRFFQTALTHDANLNINGGSEILQYYMSGGYRKAGSMVPNTSQDKISFLMKGTAKLSSKTSVTASANYVENDIQEGLGGASAGGWINSILTYPLRYDILEYQKPNGEPLYSYIESEDDGRNARISPMWGVMRNPRNNNVNRFIVNGSVDYKATDWLKLNYRLGQDWTSSKYRTVTTPGTPGSYFEGFVSESNSNSKFITSTFNATVQKKILDDFNLSLILGANSDYYESAGVGYQGEGFLVPDIFSPNVIERDGIILSESLSRRQRYAIYGDLSFSYKNLLTIGMTGRNDWTSTLSPQHRQFYSPSYSGSFTFSELISPEDWFGKLRVSYAKVGKDAPIYRTNTNLRQVATVGGGFVVDATGGNPNLRPERTSEFEIGTELGFWNRRLNIDFTYYKRESIDMIMTPRVPLPSGYVIMTFNAGSLWNRGIEASVNIIPVKNDNITWSSTLNAWKNTSKMTQFAGDIVRFPYTNAQLTVGKAASALDEHVLGISGTDYKRTEEGYVVVDANGYPVIDATEKTIGNREPEFNIGWLNKINYKGFNLSFMWDFRFGGDILNASRQRMMSTGTGYDVGQWRDKEFVFNGVVAQEDGSYVKNEKPVVLNYSFFANNYYQVGTNFVEKINWARVRYITLGYTLPSSLASKFGLNRLGLEFSAQNPFIITNYSGGDPEVNSAGPNAGGAGGASTMGVDNGAIPLPRAFSFGLNIGL
ncbi:SusC/RagA family TonB-linked outer membrane protein [Sphingobacterium bovistauri]|uniref:SusC/RagA family TonB-linked outer membrane protein n=1 Tax=Sphingobacterium bovistauri TaxID=2781959 RepID=A0ABS7Z6A0_9SPHI|nr:SusC/RagA family TonB-linked outer membrane protein [Sphingobacterium bovistauri]MCA5005715.1 SusC/RagA family TonB-linked outer membrane protein [Sphingobacterium bovistauri]